MENSSEATELTNSRSSALKIINSIIRVIDKINPFVRWVSIIGMAIFVAMVGLTFVNVILRYIFNRPLDATVELTELMMVIVVFLGLGYSQLTKTHVIMDIVIDRLRPRPKLVMEGFANLLSMVLFGVIIWQTALYAIHTSNITPVLSIPINLFAGLVPFGSLLLLILLLRNFLRNIADSLAVKGKLWLMMISMPIAVIFIALYLILATPLALSPPVIGIIGIVIMLIFFCTGMPIAFVLMGLGLVVMIYIRGIGAGLNMLSTSWYQAVASYSWSPLMFFVLMGYICFYSGLGKDLFHAASKFLGHLPGGLGMATVAACTAFGAVVGDNLTGSITMTAIGLPEMRRYKYDDKLAIGALTCSGTLGTLIPPSIILILYGVLAQQSIAELFIAGILPGIVCAIAFMLLVYVRSVRNSNLGPPTPKANWKERTVSLKSGGPIALLFIIVIGGMYAGIFTPTEGGGIGAFGALMLALAMGRLKWSNFSNSLVESAKLICMAFALLGGAMIFGYALTVSRLPYVMADFAASLPVAPMVIMLMILVILFVLGCFIPAIPLLLITVPIFLPIAISLHWDLIWFGVIMVLMFNVAAITPPFGINLFVMKGITGVSMSFIFKSVMPFVWVLLIAVALIVAFPPISTWLPYLFH